MEVVDVIGGAVAGESHEAEAAGADLARLLHAAGPPLQHRRAFEAELRQQVVGRLGCAGECAGEDLRVSDDEGFLAGYGRLGKVNPDLERLGFERAGADLRVSDDEGFLAGYG